MATCSVQKCKCVGFKPQKWASTKCHLCFHWEKEHQGNTPQTASYVAPPAMKVSSAPSTGILSGNAKTMAIWEWTDDATNWTAFLLSDIEKVEGGYQKAGQAEGEGFVEMGQMSWNSPSDATRYRFDYLKMTQTNLSSKKQRGIRRRADVPCCPKKHEMIYNDNYRFVCNECGRTVNKEGYYKCQVINCFNRCLRCQGLKMMVRNFGSMPEWHEAFERLSQTQLNRMTQDVSCSAELRKENMSIVWRSWADVGRSFESEDGMNTTDLTFFAVAPKATRQAGLPYSQLAATDANFVNFPAIRTPNYFDEVDVLKNTDQLKFTAKNRSGMARVVTLSQFLENIGTYIADLDLTTSWSDSIDNTPLQLGSQFSVLPIPSGRADIGVAVFGQGNVNLHVIVGPGGDIGWAPETPDGQRVFFKSGDGRELKAISLVPEERVKVKKAFFRVEVHEESVAEEKERYVDVKNRLLHLQIEMDGIPALARTTVKRDEAKVWGEDKQSKSGDKKKNKVVAPTDSRRNSASPTTSPRSSKKAENRSEDERSSVKEEAKEDRRMPEKEKQQEAYGGLIISKNRKWSAERSEPEGDVEILESLITPAFAAEVRVDELTNDLETCALSAAADDDFRIQSDEPSMPEGEGDVEALREEAPQDASRSMSEDEIAPSRENDGEEFEDDYAPPPPSDDILAFGGPPSPPLSFNAGPSPSRGPPCAPSGPPSPAPSAPSRSFSPPPPAPGPPPPSPSSSPPPPVMMPRSSAMKPIAGGAMGGAGAGPGRGRGGAPPPAARMAVAPPQKMAPASVAAPKGLSFKRSKASSESMSDGFASAKPTSSSTPAIVNSSSLACSPSSSSSSTAAAPQRQRSSESEKRSSGAAPSSSVSTRSPASPPLPQQQPQQQQQQQQQQLLAGQFQAKMAAPAKPKDKVEKADKQAEKIPEGVEIETGLLLANVQVGDTLGPTLAKDEVPFAPATGKRAGRKPGVAVRATWMYYGVAGDGGVDAERLRRFVKQMLFERREKMLAHGSLVSGYGSWGGPENAPIKLFGLRLTDACDAVAESMAAGKPVDIPPHKDIVLPFHFNKPPVVPDVTPTITPIAITATATATTTTPATSAIPPVKGIAAIPVLPLRDACKPLSGVVNGIESAVSTALQRAPKAPGKATKEHTAAVYLYTMASAFYRDLNAALRNPDRSKLKPYYSYLRLLAEAMILLPAPKSTVLWRGVGLDLEKDHSVGTDVTWWGVSSCTPKLAVANGFLGSSGPRTLFSVHSNTAVPIQELSAFKGEEEFILAPGTRLAVDAVQREPNGLVRVTLKELPPPRNVD